jgi:cellulose biosynthesis protein BcsQ
MTQFIFFSGKGGVGKTSMACTHAVRYADEGKRTLIVTTDPASNLADVFEQKIGHQITAMARVCQIYRRWRLILTLQRKNILIAPCLLYVQPSLPKWYR